MRFNVSSSFRVSVLCDVPRKLGYVIIWRLIIMYAMCLLVNTTVLIVVHNGSYKDDWPAGQTEYLIRSSENVQSIQMMEIACMYLFLV